MSDVKLVAVTKGVNELNDLGSEEIVSFIARVSNPSNQSNFESAPKLLAYLIKHSHWSPFEHAFMTLEITTSRGIAAQILRHRSFVFQEFSQRYSKSDSYISYPARRQDIKNRQNSVDDMSEDDRIWFSNMQADVWEMAKRLYDEALKRGVAKEQARFLLPLNTKTTIYMTGNLRSWIHYINLRTENGTQLEHSQIAQLAKDIFCEQFPSIAKALNWETT